MTPWSPSLRASWNLCSLQDCWSLHKVPFSAFQLLPLLNFCTSQFSTRAQYIHFRSLSRHSVFAKKKLSLLLLIRVESSSWSSDTSILFITNFGWTHQEVSSWNIPMESQMKNLSSNCRLFRSASWPMSSFQVFQISHHLKFEFPCPWFIHRPGLFSTQGLFGSAKCGERNYFQHVGNSALGCHILKNFEHREPVSLKYHLGNLQFHWDP